MALRTEDRGNKHECLRCQTKFYDLLRPQIVCPRCGVDQAEEAAKLHAAAAARKKHRAKPVAAIKPVAAVEPEADDLDGVGDDEEDEVEDLDDDDDAD